MEKTLETATLGFLAWTGIVIIYRALLYPALQMKCRYRLSQIRDEIYFATLNKKLNTESKAYRVLDSVLQLDFALANVFLKDRFFSPAPRKPEQDEFPALFELIEQNENRLLRGFFYALLENMMAWFFAERPVKAVSYMFLRLMALFSDRAHKMIEKLRAEPFNAALVLTHQMSG